MLGFRTSTLSLIASFLCLGNVWGYIDSSDSISIRYERYVVIESGEQFAWADTVITTIYQIPVISGLADPLIQEKLNRFLKPGLLDTSEPPELEEILSVRQMNPREPDPHAEPMLFYEYTGITFVDNNILSYHQTSFSPGGPHPNTDVSVSTISVKTLEPISLDLLFREGYTQVFEKAVRETALDSLLMARWIDAAAHQFHGQGVLITDTAFVLGRDLEWDLGYPHSERGFSEIDVPYTMLRDLIRPDGPLGRYAR